MTAPGLSFRPDPTSASPLYLQLAQALEGEITAGRLQADAALPSERQLAEALKLSRVTTRKAIARLVDRRLVERRRGSGTYITPRLAQPLARLSGFTEELHRRGFVPQSRWLARGLSEATPDEGLALGLPEGEAVARLERLRLAGDTVMAYEASVLPASALPDPQTVGASLYDHLAQAGHAPVRARQHIRALSADAALAKRLRLRPAAAVLWVTRLGYLASGRAIELTHSYCHAEHYEFVTELVRD